MITLTQRLKAARNRDLALRELSIVWWRPAIAAAVLALAIAVRVTGPMIGLEPQIEFMTAAAFMSALLLRHRIAFMVPVMAIAISDSIIHNSAILLFTWSAWMVIGLGALLFRHLKPGLSRYGYALGFGVGATMFHFVWTNFGVWLLYSWYPSTLAGLVNCYVMAIPFVRMQLLGNLVLVPLAVGVVSLVERAERAHNLVPALRPTR